MFCCFQDFHGHLCLVCPLHHHHITLARGESLYMSVDPFDPAAKPSLKSKGICQRRHTVKIDGQQVLVRLETQVPKKVDSDFYSSDEYKRRLAQAQRH